MKCQAIKKGEVKRKGKPSLEYYKNGKPQYFCYGWNDSSTGELIETCLKCKYNVVYAENKIIAKGDLDNE